MEAPFINALQSQNSVQFHPFFGFSDSSWNDDADTGRSTGCFIITYVGGVVDHSSNMPDPVTLSSAEAEYNEGCVAFMAASHLRMLLCELEGVDESTLSPTTIFFDSKSAIVMGSSYKDTKHTRYIQRRYHYSRENIANNRFSMDWITSEFQIADIGSVALIHIKVGDQLMQIQEG